MILRVIVQLLLFAGLVFSNSNSGQFSVLDYGANPDGKTLSTTAIQKTIDECAKAGGGKVIIPSGKYLTRPIFLKSNIHVEILPGAVILADTVISEYPSIWGRYGGIEANVYASLFTGKNLENVSITGRGTLDGQGEVWWKAHEINKAMRKKAGLTEREPPNPNGSPLKWARPRMINLYNCKNVLLRDLTIVDSPSWTIHPVYCENVTIENISIIQPYESPNTDGINPESCNNVRIFNCFVDCGDDCITIKSGYNEDGRRVNIPCENIVISNCTFKHGRSAIGIGSETSGGVRNVTISNCVFKDTYRGLRIKTTRGRGNVVENIRASNIIMENVGTGISLDMFYQSGPETPLPVDETTPFFKNIRYSHITGKNIKLAGEFLGLPEAPMEGVTLTDVNLQAETGIVVKFAKDISFHDVEINVKKGPPLSFYKSTQIELDNVTTSTPLKNNPVFQFENVQDVIVRDCTASQGTDVFLQFVGKENKDVMLLNNRLNKAQQPIRFTKGATKSLLNEQ
jgi:polygalacturonase